MRYHGTDAVEGAEAVDPPDRFERLGGLAVERLAPKDTGVVDEHVQSPERADRPFDRRRPRRGVPDVKLHRNRSLAELVADRDNVVDQHVAGDDTGAGLDKAPGDGAPLPAGGAGDNGDLSVELVHVFVPVGRASWPAQKRRTALSSAIQAFVTPSLPLVVNHEGRLEIDVSFDSLPERFEAHKATTPEGRVMTAVSVEFDPFSDEYFNDPTEVYRRLRDEAPVYFSERYGFYALSRFADVLAAHRDWQAFSSAHGVDLSTLSQDPKLIKMFRSIIMMDPPEHDRLRALVSRVFTPRAVVRLEPMIREVISGLLAPFEDASDFDVVADFSALFPVEIISRMLGVPEGERQQIRHWLDLGLHREPGRLDPLPEGEHAMIQMGAYFYELAAEKRKHPADDMLSALTQVTVDRGDGVETGLDDAEIAGFATLLGGAGAETVTKLVGNAAVLFSRNPDQWQKVRRDVEKIPHAVEETLRFLPPSQYQGRFSMEAREYEGGTIPPGFPVLLLTGAATRDPRAFDRADEFDIERPPSVSIGFGHGVHACLGAALARMESRIAIEELAKRWRRLDVDEARLRRVHMSNVAGYSHVPVHVAKSDGRDPES